nr:12 kda heat shock protein [Quercus suber]
MRCRQRIECAHKPLSLGTARESAVNLILRHLVEHDLSQDPHHSVAILDNNIIVTGLHNWHSLRYAIDRRLIRRAVSGEASLDSPFACDNNNDRWMTTAEPLGRRRQVVKAAGNSTCWFLTFDDAERTSEVSIQLHINIDLLDPGSLFFVHSSSTPICSNLQELHYKTTSHISSFINMSDSLRQSNTDKLGSSMKPDSQKTTMESVSDSAKSAGDSIAGSMQPEGQKSTSQKATDSVTGGSKDAGKQGDSMLNQASEGLSNAANSASESLGMNKK